MKEQIEKLMERLHAIRDRESLNGSVQVFAEDGLTISDLVYAIDALAFTLKAAQSDPRKPQDLITEARETLGIFSP